MITNRYTYTLEWQNNSVNVHPIEDNVAIEYEKIDYMAYLRPKITGSFVFYNSAKDSIYDYDIFTTTPWWMVFTLNIFRDSDTDPPTPNYVCKFRIYDGAYDADRCTFTVTPEIYDAYNCFLYNIEDELNVLAITDDKYSVYHYTTEYEYESTFTYQVQSSAPNLTPPQYIWYNNTPSSSNYKYTKYNVEYDSNFFMLKTEYRRDILYTRTNSQPGTEWGIDPTSNPNSNGDYKWVRIYKNIDPSTPNPYKFYLTTPIITGYILNDEIIPLPIIKTDRCILLNDILTALIGECDSSDFPLTYYSKFFQDTTNYVLDTVGYPPGVNINPLQYIMMLPVSEIKNKSDEATRAMVSFSDIIKMLYDTFQVQWFIDDNNRVRIEHVSWFDSNIQQGLDLTNSSYIDYIKSKNQWEYDYQNIKSEIWKFMNASNIDFIGDEISYTNQNVNLVMYRDSDIIEHNIPSIITDIDYAFSKPANLPSDGWFMFQVYFTDYHDVNTSGYGVNEYWSGYDIGVISGVYGHNRHISTANLHNYYWKHRRPFLYGQMNGQFTNFITTEYIKIQTEITIPACDIDVNKLVKTEIGWGKVIKATEDFKTRTIKLTVAHRAGTQI